VQWLVAQQQRFRGSLDFTHALLLLMQETSVLGYTSDYVDVQWYPAGFSIVEQPVKQIAVTNAQINETLRDRAFSTDNLFRLFATYSLDNTRNRLKISVV